MLDAQSYLGHVRSDGARIAEVGAQHPEADVPSCPGTTIAAMLVHTGGVMRYWTEAIAQGRQPEIDWSTMPTDPTAAHADGLDRLIRILDGADGDRAAWTWAGPGRLLFWFRRAAQELAVHRWDVENAVGHATPIDTALAVDGVDELLDVFGPTPDGLDAQGAANRFGGDGEIIGLEATDQAARWSVTTRPDAFDVVRDSASGDVTARGTASDLLLFLWGRVPPSALEVSGDASLLVRWQERVKI